MKKVLVVSLITVLFMALMVVVSEAASTCWRLVNYPTDSIKVNQTIYDIFVGGKLITGNWVMEVNGEPTSVIMVGTSQKVLPNNVDAGEIYKQMMLTGTVFSPDFGCANTENCAKTKHCGLLMRFNDSYLTNGSVDGWCSYFVDANSDTVTAHDKFRDSIYRVPCSSVPNP